MHTLSTRRSLYVTLLCWIALLALLLRGTPVHAQAVTLDVDAATGTVGTGDACPSPRDSAIYTTIQKAVDCAQTGDTVSVGAGTYAEAVTIDKALTLQGNGREDDANATRIDTTVVHGIAGRSSCLVIANGTSDVTISGFRFEGDGQQPGSHDYGDGENAIYFTSFDSANRLAGITISGNTIVGTDRAIVAGGFLTASEISDNLFEGITDWWVILIQNFDNTAVLDDLTISGNEIRNSTSVPIALMNYSPSPNMSNVLLENNYIHDNDASNPRTAGHIWNREGQSGGIVARYGWQNMTIRNNVIVNNLDMSGVGIWGTSLGYANLAIEGNILHNNTGSDRFAGGSVDPSDPASGIKVQWGGSSYDTSTWSVTGNSMAGNSFGLWYDGSYGTLTAEDNWWGSANGPLDSAGSTELPAAPEPAVADMLNAAPAGALGDEVSEEVDYYPWLGSSLASEVWVDDDWSGQTDVEAYDPSLVWQYDAFAVIQDGVDAVASSGTVHVLAGTYTETVVISKSLTVRGATYDVNKNGYTVPANYAWDPAVESIISAPNPFLDGIVVDIANTNNVTFEGFVVQSLHSTGSGGVGSDPHLVRVSARTQTVDNVIIRNNVIGPNTHPLQDGTMGRMGLYLATPGYGDYDLTNSLIRGNLIMDAKGNGNNVFIGGAADSYHNLGNTDYGGTVIEDNEIYGSHRSGIEIAGGVDNLTIRGNAIHSSSGLPTDDPANLNYGNGILIVRMGSDKDNPAGYGPNNLTISGNVIYDNEKNGIYMGPVNANHRITSNVLRENGGDGLRIDLEENYYGGTWPVYDRVQNIVMTYNRILDNAGYGSQMISTPTNGFVLDAENNWWGCNYGPGAGGVGCAGTPDDMAGLIDADPWLTLDLGITPSTLPAGAPATLDADLTGNSDDQDTSTGGYLPDGTPAAFGATAGLIAATPVTTTGGVATTIWTSGPDGTTVLSTTVDGQTITRTAVISAHGTAVSVALSPDPYTLTAGESVTYTVVATDTYGNQWNATDEASYDIATPAGGLWIDNVYTSAISGTWTVTATVDGIDENATLAVTHGTAASVTLSPDLHTLTAGESVTYTVTADDGYGNQWDASGETVWAIDPAAGGAWSGSTYTSEVAGTWTVAATVDGVPGTATLTVLEPDGSTIYLPLVSRAYTAAPDLVVEQIVATADRIEVVIANRGTGAISQLPENTFWVDVYLDPVPAPAAVNEIWPMLGAQGAVWGVTPDALPLAPGDTLTLTTGGPYYWPEYSTIEWPLSVGTAVYAQVDSAHTGTTYGAIREEHEIVGTAYNNIRGPQLSTAAVTPDANASTEAPAARAPRPPRP